MIFKKRKCACCNADHSELIWRDSLTVRTRRAAFYFFRPIAICRKCGFVYSLKVPSEKVLRRYYRDNWCRYEKQALDYDVYKRLDTIDHHIDGTERVFLEVGSNEKTAFIRELKKKFCIVITIEPNTSVDAQYRNLTKVPNNSIDIIAHYFVLEHISSPQIFLKNCWKKLRLGGKMIIEVPDLNYCAKDPSSLMFHEHFNHFSPETLAQCASIAGFSLISWGRLGCSREFGFYAVFNKVDQLDRAEKSYKGYSASKLITNKALDIINNYQTHLDKAYDQLLLSSKKNEKAVLWGANCELLRFLNQRIIPEHVTIIDSDPSKRNFVSKQRVYTPAQAKQKILEADSFYIFAKLSSKTILKSLKKTLRTAFNKKRIWLVEDLNKNFKD